MSSTPCGKGCRVIGSSQSCDSPRLCRAALGKQILTAWSARKTRTTYPVLFICQYMKSLQRERKNKNGTVNQRMSDLSKKHGWKLLPCSCMALICEGSAQAAPKDSYSVHLPRNHYFSDMYLSLFCELLDMQNYKTSLRLTAQAHAVFNMLHSALNVNALRHSTTGSCKPT